MIPFSGRIPFALIFVLATGIRVSADEPAYADFKAAVAARSYRQSRLLGRQGGPPDARTVIDSSGGYLFGFECGLNQWFEHLCVAAVRPRFQTPNGIVVGNEIGPFKDTKVGGRLLRTRVTESVVLEAKPGYAVAGIRARFGLYCNQLAVNFAKIDGDHLDLSDSYSSPWAGKSDGGSEMAFSTEGRVPIGVEGFADEGMYSLRLLLYPSTVAIPASEVPADISPPGFSGDPEMEELVAGFLATTCLTICAVAFGVVILICGFVFLLVYLLRPPPKRR